MSNYSKSHKLKINLWLVKFELSLRFKQIKKNNRQVLVTTMVVSFTCLFLVGFLITVNNLRNNYLNNHRAIQLIGAANDNARKNGNKPAPLAANAAPSTIKPTGGDLADYIVAPNMPRYIKIPSIGVNARIVSVGLTSSGAINTPSNVFDTAWYRNSSLPGQPGAMIIDGHISSWTTQGVFFNLNKLNAGDEIQVVRGDGAIFTYKVASTQIYSSDNVDMNAVINPVNPGTAGLNLISCFGNIISGTNEFNKRIVVYATLI